MYTCGLSYFDQKDYQNQKDFIILQTITQKWLCIEVALINYSKICVVICKIVKDFLIYNDYIYIYIADILASDMYFLPIYVCVMREN